MDKSIKDIDRKLLQITLKKAIYIALVSYTFYFLLYTILSLQKYAFAIITLGIGIFIHLILIFLLKKNLYKLTNIIFLAINEILLVALSYFIVGFDSGTHYFFLIFAILALPIYRKKGLELSILMLIINYILFAVAEYNLIQDFSVIELPERLSSIFRMTCMFMSYMIIFYIFYLYFRNNEIKDEELVQNQNQLQEINCQLEEIQQELEVQKETQMQLNEELQANLELLYKQNIELEVANKTKDKFFSIIAHDLKNPLSSLVGLTDILNEKIDVYDIEKIKKFTIGIGESANNLKTLVLNLLDWSRAQLGSIKPNKILFSLCDVLIKNQRLAQQNLAEKNIKLVINCNRELIVYADMNMIDTVIRNLVSNAIKFTYTGGEININAEGQQNRTILKISDTGVGMSEEQIANLFKIDKTESTFGTNREKGSGLGLLLCDEFLKLNRCTLDVTSKEDKGTTFKIIFPTQEEK